MPDIMEENTMEAVPAAPVTPAPETPPPPTTPAPAAADAQLFSAEIANLDPAVRERVEPMVKNWQSQLNEWKTTQETRVKEIEEGAKAFDFLKNNQKFVNWYNKEVELERGGQQQPQAPAREPGQDLTQDQLQATYEDPVKWQALVQNEISQAEKARFTPIINRIEQRQQQQEEKQKQIDSSIEMEAMFRNHPDAYELDKTGLLEPFLYDLSDRQGKSMEIAYQAAKRAYDGVLSKANQKAAGIVQDTKQSVTQGPSTSNQDQGGVTFADSPEQALRMQVEATMEGRKVKVRVKPRK